MIQQKQRGITREGSIFIVLQSLIFRIESPELAIRKPPTMDNSVIIPAVIKFPSSRAAP